MPDHDDLINVSELISVARAMPADQVRGTEKPIGVFLLEADGVALFVDTYWEATEELPGLKNVKKLDPQIGGKIRLLVAEARLQHALSLMPKDDPRRAKLQRALEVLRELGAAVEFELDDGVHEPADDAFAEAKARHAEDDSLAAIVQALVDYGTIARELEERLIEDLADFDPKWIDEAFELSKALGSGGLPTPGRSASAEIDMRNRLITVADKLIGEVRRATKWTFRKHPEIIRQVMSAYDRRLRLAAKRRKLAEEQKSKAAALPSDGPMD